MYSPEGSVDYFKREANLVLAKDVGLIATAGALAEIGELDQELSRIISDRLALLNSDPDIRAGVAFASQTSTRYPFGADRYLDGLREFMNDCKSGEHHLFIFHSEREVRTKRFEAGVDIFFLSIAEQNKQNISPFSIFRAVG